MKPHSIAYWVDSCCSGGGVLVIRQWVNSGNYVIMCDDCEAEWENPNVNEETRLHRNREKGEIRNPTLEEIKALGWDQYIKGNYIDYTCV